MDSIIGYVRVSTAKQGTSGLSLEVQNDAIVKFAVGKTLIAVYCEVESGKKCDRPELAKALAHAKQAGATLAIAKLDRLSRNLAFIANLMDAGVEVVACDMPFANRLTLHIMAVIAEHEGRVISERIKAALAKAKERGVKLGGANPKGHEARCAALARGHATQSKRAGYDPIVDELYAQKGYSK